jgi:hypothetical protein
MKINILTSCTGDKAVIHHRMLSLDDFQRGPNHVRGREVELEGCLRTAEEMYTGQQHVRLMEGVRAARRRGIDVTVKVISAGYGLIDGTRKIAPYNTTFNEMRPARFRAWAETLDIRKQVAKYLAKPADLSLVLLGDRYLDASDLASLSEAGSPMIAFCGKASVSRFAPIIRTIAFEQADTTRFGSNMIGLKGELAKRLLNRVHEGRQWTLEDLALGPLQSTQEKAIKAVQASLFDELSDPIVPEDDHAERPSRMRRP